MAVSFIGERNWSTQIKPQYNLEISIATASSV